MIGVSKTFGGSSILSSPAVKEPEKLENKRFWFFSFLKRYHCCVVMGDRNVLDFYGMYGRVASNYYDCFGKTV